MQFPDFVQWCFYGLMGGSVVYGVTILAHLKNSIDTLNEKIAVVIEKTSWHEKILDRHSAAIEQLQSKS